MWKESGAGAGQFGNQILARQKLLKNAIAHQKVMGNLKVRRKCHVPDTCPTPSPLKKSNGPSLSSPRRITISFEFGVKARYGN